MKVPSPHHQPEGSCLLDHSFAEKIRLYEVLHPTQQENLKLKEKEKFETRKTQIPLGVFLPTESKSKCNDVGYHGAISENAPLLPSYFQGRILA